MLLPFDNIAAPILIIENRIISRMDIINTLIAKI
jgi:hypothetical protein